MAKEVSQLTIPASSTGVIVQTLGKAAGKTFIQAALAVLVLLAVPELVGWADDVRKGTAIDIDFVFWRNVSLAALGGGVAALISFLWNYFGAKTLTPGHTVEAEVKP